MGFIQDKQSLISEIGIFKTINDLPESKLTSSFGSVKSASKNVLPYLLELLSTSCEDGTEQEKPEFNPNFTSQPPKGSLLRATGGSQVKCNALRILIEILVEFLPELIRIMKEAIVVAIKEALSCSSDFEIQPNTVMVIDIETIDYNSLLKTNPDSNILGGLFFGSVNKDFNRFLHGLLETPNVLGTWEGPNGPLLEVTYIEPSQYLFKVATNYENTSFNDFISDYMSSIELFNKKILLSTVIDYFFSNITFNLDFSLEQLVNEEKTNKLMDKILDEDPCYDDIVYDDSFFSFSNDEVELFERKAYERKSGYVSIDLGCGVFKFYSNIDLNLNLSNLTDLEESSDAQSEENVIKNVINSLEDEVTKVSEVDKESIKNKLHYDFILNLPKILMKSSVLTPKILGIYNFSNFIVNNTTITERNSFDFVKANRIFFEYVLRESLAVLVKIVFEKLKRELLRLIAKVINRLLKGIIDKKLKIITSYTLSILSGVVSGLVNQIPSPQPQGSQYK
jgi:hypothetical protein